MKNIIGLDLGTASIGWAYVHEAENENEVSSIEKLGVRVNPLTVDEKNNFGQGKSITTNADRTLKRSIRKNLQRYKLRREQLIKILREYHIINNDTILTEVGNNTTFETYRLRAKAASEEISLEQFARVLLMINKKRGYKSSRKINNKEDGESIDGMEVARYLYDNHLTPGQYGLKLLNENKKYIPDFYASDLKDELHRIWQKQSIFYPNILTNELWDAIQGKKERETCKIFLSTASLYTAQNKGKDKKMQSYKWRADALEKQLSIEEAAYVIASLNGSIASSSGYLGGISDRSKHLFFNKQTVGQYLMDELGKDPHFSLSNKVFYRQDYFDEFEKIWETQSKYHKELTPDLKREIRDVVIFYQRSLKSQKGLISFCEFESKTIPVIVDGKTKMKTVGRKVCPKSSPLFQEFKIWQVLNDLRVNDKPLEQDQKEILFKELNIKEKMSKTEALKLLYSKPKGLDLNFKSIEGNRTMASLFSAYQTIIYETGHGEYDFSKMRYDEVIAIIKPIFTALGFNADILYFDSSIVDDEAFQQQPIFQLWHLLYSFEGDNSKTGYGKLLEKLMTKYGFDKESALIISKVKLMPDYGNLSTKALRRIIPYIMEGNQYSLACEYAGYRHSKQSLTSQEIRDKVYKDKLDLLPHNSLRNPVVEKIINQMVNVVNGLVEVYGKPDEIRIELARELKKSAKERTEITQSISKSTTEYEGYRNVLINEFGFTNVSRNDLLRYKLYLELESNGFKTLYSDTYIRKEELFSKKFDIEHIIPQARLFDDSFSNKTLESHFVNQEKSNATAYDYVEGKYGKAGVENFEKNIEKLFKEGKLSRAKRNKLLMREADIPSDFINRDLSDSQYIARTARNLLLELVPSVVSTTGSITDRLREDWQLVNVMQELNWNKYDKLGLTEVFEDKDGRKIHRIKDWTKRNDHRHHAMDALTIAFTKPSYIQYLNNLNAQSNENSIIYNIRNKELSRDSHNKLRFLPPIPLNEFRAQAKHQLENVLVSVKAKNKVVTNNVNKIKVKGGIKRTIEQTPRGQLHNETIYGSSLRYIPNNEKVNASFNIEKIKTIANKAIREALFQRLQENDNDSKKAFTGKNSLDKKPIYLDSSHTKQVPVSVKTVHLERIFTKREEISPSIKIEKVLDKGIKTILENRLKEYNGNATLAFSNLDENPIWLNKEKEISIKRVVITAVNNAEPLHDKRDQFGNLIYDINGLKQPVDYVNTSNNHHVAIYRDENGNLQELMVPFFKAIARAIQKLEVVDKNYKSEDGWQFLFTMKQNEYFIFPNKEIGFNPTEIDLLNPDNYSLISPNLYRVQKITSKDYFFRHHLETTVQDNKELRGITYKRITSLSNLEGIVKVRINNIGQIVSFGEY